MEYDRRSNVSSFYGARKNSFDALNSDFPSSSTAQLGQPNNDRNRVDSFYDTGRASRPSRDYVGGTQSAGYNRMSFADAGRMEPLKGGYDEEEEVASSRGAEPSWDVYADFNNQGPRYSTAFGQRDTGYRQVPSPVPASKTEEDVNVSGPVEMVTVPVLGPEWKASELGNKPKKELEEAKRDARARKWKEWKRGERGLCGRYFTRKFLVWFAFAFCIALAVVLVFVIPRVPGFEFNSDQPLTTATAPFNETIPVEFSPSPTNFSFPANIDLEVNTQSSFLSLHFTHFDAQVFDLQTGKQVGTGSLPKFSLPAKKFPIITVPLNFTYLADNTTDQTWANWHNACENPAVAVGGTRPPLQFRLVLDFGIAGLIGSKAASAQVNNAPCPIVLPQDAP